MNKNCLFFCFALCTQTAFSQTSPNNSPHSSLYDTIRHMDSVMFDAFNTHDLPVLQSVFAETLEFYHDKGGLSGYTSSMESFKKIFQTTPDLRRELVTGTLEVYPVPGYGAIEMGQHRFTHLENGQAVTAVFKFTQVWQFKDNKWKVTRVVSVGH